MPNERSDWLLSRRSALVSPLVLMSLGDSPAAANANPLVVSENRQPGTTDWQLTNINANAGRWPPPSANSNAGTPKRSKAIEGYCRQQSVEAGQTLEICVSTDPPRRFTMEFFRMGYYGGAGARLVRTIGPFEGKPQPEPPVGEHRLRECRWEPAVSFAVPADWPSGVYVGKLACVPETKNEHAWQNYVIFIVRDHRKADILYQASDNTWAAYNRWPDNYSLYSDPRANYAFDVTVSFDRPCSKDPHIFSHPLSLGSGLIENGTYTVTEEQGANAGQHRVEIRWLKRTGKKYRDIDSGEMVDERQEALPPRFHQQSELTAEVSKNHTTFDFDLKSK